MVIFVQACFPKMVIFPSAVIGAMDFVQACFPQMAIFVQACFP
jgi:hypothetical protein